jgi:hypothetical protein
MGALLIGLLTLDMPLPTSTDQRGEVLGKVVEARYQGRSLGEWVKLLKDSDPWHRVEAAKAPQPARRQSRSCSKRCAAESRTSSSVREKRSGSWIPRSLAKRVCHKRRKGIRGPCGLLHTTNYDGAVTSIPHTYGQKGVSNPREPVIPR